MNGIIALIGGEEFSDGFEGVHAQLAKMVRQHSNKNNGQPPRVTFLPSCAAHDGQETVEYWCNLARERLQGFGLEVSTPWIIDPDSANLPGNVRAIAEADWIYIGGGYPHVGISILEGSLALKELYHARQRGALISGASAGAMLLGARSWVITPEFDQAITEFFSQGGNPDEFEIPIPPSLNCLGFIPAALCWPHLNQFFSMKWLERGIVPPDCTMIGIDEQTALVSLNGATWQVFGKGRVMIIDPQKQASIYHAGNRVSLDSQTQKIQPEY